MPGGVSVGFLIDLFDGVSMPATARQLKADSVGSHEWRQLVNGVGYKYVHQEGNKYWLNTDVMAKEIESLNKEITNLERRRDFFMAQLKKVL